MTRNELRIQYSGLIIFGAQLISVVTGTIFILLLTRNMTRPEFGVWSNVFDLVGYFLIFSGLIPFWAIRFVARGVEYAVKTAVVANLVAALISAAVYISLIPPITSTLHIAGSYLVVYVLASVQIVTTPVVNVLESCLRARRPQAIGYGLLIEEICKLILAFVLIVGFHQLFFGAMLSLIAGALVQTLYYVKLLWSEFRHEIRWRLVREWLKGSAALLYNSIGGQLAAFVFIILLVYGGQAARADYQAAMTFAAVIGYSSSLAFALYPKLLAENGLAEVTGSLRTVLMFGLPMTAIVMAVSPSLLTVLNVAYSSAFIVLLVLSIDALIGLLLQFYTSVLYGIERFDENAEIPLTKLVKTRMFKALSLPYLQAAITLPAALFAVAHLASGQPVLAAAYAAATIAMAHLVMLVLTWHLTRASAKIAIPWRSITKYALASIVTGTLLYALPHPTTLMPTFAAVLLGIATYASLVLAMDNHARILIRSILKELRIDKTRN